MAEIDAALFEEYRREQDIDAMSDRARLRMIQDSEQSLGEFARILGATVMHERVQHGERTICSCGDFNCASLDVPTVCSFSLGARGYCMGSKSEPHDSQCPRGEY